MKPPTPADLQAAIGADQAVIPACAGKWRLFDSTTLDDHRRAAEFCAVCPMRAACEEGLLAARREQPIAGAAYGPQGTWAGRLLNPRQGKS